MHTLAWTACLSLVTCSLGEQHLRSDSLSSLITEDPLAGRPSTLVARQQSLLSRARGMFVPKEDFEALTDVKSFGVMNEGEILVTFCTWLFFYFLCAVYYHNKVRFFEAVEEEREEREKRDNYKDFQEFRTGLCGCSEEPDITFWACCCPGLRWADTMGKLGIYGWWHSFCVLTCLYCISFIPIATGFCFFVVVCFMTYHRQEFRKAFDFEEQGGMTWVTDCLSYCCCMCCTVAQEARQCREAVAVVHPAINPATARVDV